MCIATAAAVAAVAGTGLKVAGDIYQGNVAKQTADYQAQVAKNNAAIAGQQADYSIEAGDVQATVQGMKNRAQLAGIKTKQAANNLDVNSGSAVKVRAGQAESGTENVLQTKNSALLTAYGYKANETSDLAQSQLDTFSGKAAQTGSYISAAGDLFSGASQIPKFGGGGAPKFDPSKVDV